MDKKKKAGIILLIIGGVVLIAGTVFALVNILAEPKPRDADYLVKVGEWEREDTPGVIWNFTEIGKGTLTTNNHTNDYDFIWSLEEDELKIETDWLYALDDTYNYVLDQSNATLTLNDAIVFRPMASTDEED